MRAKLAHSLPKSNTYTQTTHSACSQLTRASHSTRAHHHAVHTHAAARVCQVGICACQAAHSLPNSSQTATHTRHSLSNRLTRASHSTRVHHHTLHTHTAARVCQVGICACQAAHSLPNSDTHTPRTQHAAGSHTPGTAHVPTTTHCTRVRLACARLESAHAKQLTRCQTATHTHHALSMQLAHTRLAQHMSPPPHIARACRSRAPGWNLRMPSCCTGDTQLPVTLHFWARTVAAPSTSIPPP